MKVAVAHSFMRVISSGVTASKPSSNTLDSAAGAPSNKLVRALNVASDPNIRLSSSRSSNLVSVLSPLKFWKAVALLITKMISFTLPPVTTLLLLPVTSLVLSFVS